MNELKPCPFCGGKAEVSAMGWKCKDGKDRYFIECCKKLGVPVATGSFGASMEITFTNMGPVTIILECVDGKILQKLAEDKMIEFK